MNRRDCTYINAKREIEDEPDDDNRCKHTANLRSAQWLDEEEKDQDGARRSYDGRFGNVCFDDFETI